MTVVRNEVKSIQGYHCVFCRFFQK